MFSVVVPLYNKETEIQKTLESVLNQTFQKFEIIVINDGSTDKSLEIVKKISDKRIRLIDQSNGGVSVARNRGIKEAKYEWIAFLDADDIWLPKKLEKVAAVIIDNPDTTWIMSAYKVITGNKTDNRAYKHNGYFKDALIALSKGLSIQTSTIVAKKSYFLEDERLYFSPGVNNSEDREVWYRLIFRFPNPYYIQEILSYYVIDQTGKSLNTGTLGNFSFLNLEKRLENDLDNLTLTRKRQFQHFLQKYNSRACWRLWVKMGWKSEFKDSVSRQDEAVMYFLSQSPILFKRIIFKLRRIA